MHHVDFYSEDEFVLLNDWLDFSGETLLTGRKLVSPVALQHLDSDCARRRDPA